MGTHLPGAVGISKLSVYDTTAPDGLHGGTPHMHLTCSEGYVVTADVDVVIVGAGFSGLYQLYRLRELGLTCRVVEAASDVGGTWFWNRYPGARVDIPSVDYMFSFDPQWSQDWHWSEKYATQPEILRYLNHVADKHDLRRDIQFGTKVTHAHWNDDASAYRVRTDRGEEISARFLVIATGCLSVPKHLDIAGVDN